MSRSTPPDRHSDLKADSRSRPERMHWLRAGGWLLAFISAAVFVLYFRSYSLIATTDAVDARIRRMAESSVREGLSAQVEKQVEQFFPGVGGEQKQRAISERVQQIITEEEGRFLDAVQGVEARMKEENQSHYSSRYLIGADPYYYLSLTENILKTGRQGKPGPGGTFYNPLRMAPSGNWDLANWHPHAGAFLYRLCSLFGTGIELMGVLAFLPLVLSVITIGVLFLLFSTITDRVFPVWMGCILYMLAPAILQRSSFGWYDTDPYNFIFPALTLLFLMRHIKDSSKPVLYGILSGLFTGLHSLFWQGWQLLFALTAACAGLLVILHLIENRNLKKNPPLVFLGSYLLAAILLAFLVMTPAGFWRYVKIGLDYFSHAKGGSAGIWPNLIIMIDETRSTSLRKWFFMASGYLPVFISLLGSAAAAFHSFKTKQNAKFRQWLVSFLLFAALFVFSLSAERFVMLAILPLALLTVFSVEWFMQRLLRLLEKVPEPAAAFFNAPARTGLAGALIFLVMMPRILFGAHVSSINPPLIMNEKWEKVLLALRQETPEDTIVYSWWPPGYFIQAIARRGTVLDGGSQQHPAEHFWLARAFMSKDEKHAAGILRMIAAAGNRASGYLAEKGYSLAESVAMLEDVVAVSREEAEKVLPSDWSVEEKRQLLDLTHGGEKLPQGAILLYNDLIEKNILLQIISKWDFLKADKLLGPAADGQKGIRDYVQKMFDISGEKLHYNMNIPPVKVNGPVILFEQGVTVDLQTKQAFLVSDSRNTPVRLFYKEGEKWAEKETVSPLSFSAFLMEGPQGYKLATVHNDLLQTFVMRLYFFKGEGLRSVQLLAEGGSWEANTYIQAFTIDWKTLDQLQREQNAGN